VIIKRLRSFPGTVVLQDFTAGVTLLVEQEVIIEKFGVSRLVFRELALQGKIPGIVKSSW